MKKRWILILLFVLIFSTNKINVNAGICNGLKNQQYCQSPTGGFYFDHIPSISWRSNNNAYFMVPGYNANIYGSYPAFCIDPGLSFAPSGKYYNNVRELDISVQYDDGVYRIYQKLINDTQYSGSSVQLYRAYFQYALRAWTIKNGYAYINKTQAVYKYDASNFAKCIANFIDPGININSLNLETNGSCTLKYGFGDEYQKNMVSAYYNRVGEGYLWQNPLENSNAITQQVITPTEDNPNYTYKFTMNLVGESRFFTYGQAVPELNLSEAGIEGYISINGEDCTSESSCANATVYRNISYINSSHANDTIEFYVSFTPEQFEKYFPSGDGTITLNYTYHHPMNQENVFVTRYDTENALYQRMIVVKEYRHSDKSTIKIGNPVVVKENCKQDASGFTDSNGNKVDLANFITSCGCNSVNRSILSDTNYYDRVCSSSVENETYSGGVSNCSNSEDYDSENNFGGFKLGYTKVSKVNNYCNETCTENIDVQDLKGKYATLAGTYFKFNKYPTIIANKTCTVNIDYNSWLNEYTNRLRTMVDAYNAWQADIVTTRTGDCNCHQVCSGSGNNRHCRTVCDTQYYYDYSYNYVSINSDRHSLSTKPVSGTYTPSCGQTMSFNASSKKNEFLRTISYIPTLKNDLKQCNNKLSNITDNNFYNFQENLNYYYEQTLTKNNKTINNVERTSYNGINDSEFSKSGLITNVSTYDLNNSNSLNYDMINTSGNIETEKIITQTNINRIVEYKVNYIKPRQTKYASILSGTITSSKSNGNYLTLGNVYDTDVTAKAKTGNSSYYIFSKLGDSSNNKIFEHFKNDINGIKRTCDYKISNNMIIEDKFNLVYRVVDPNNIDPNNRKRDNKGLKNWTQEQIDAANNEDTFNPDNLEYSFTLDSKTIKEIREYNKNKKYSDITFDCTNGLQCKSKFIESASSGSSDFSTKFATNVNGSTKWKNLE